MTTLSIESKIHDYKVLFEKDLTFLDEVISMNNKVLIIDKNVYSLYMKNFDSIDKKTLLIVESIEENKTLKMVENIYKFLATFDAKKNLTLISIGGGIIQDLTGFVASTLYRGIKWIFVPTTFLAQADSCIGSKTSLNFETYKNILGGFYPPHKIYVAPKFLDTLDEKDFYSGIGEVIKFSLLKEKYPKNITNIVNTVNDLQNHKNILSAIHQTMTIKQAYIKEDEFDTGKRNLFNYGHCFGHALENSSHYIVPHGIAVTIGIVFANIVSFNRGLLSKDIFNEINNKLLIPNTYIKLKLSYFNQELLFLSMKNDKKRVGEHLTIVIPIDNDIRLIKTDDLTVSEFEKTYNDLLKILRIK